MKAKVNPRQKIWMIAASMLVVTVISATAHAQAQWQPSGNNIYYNSGTVGIGTTNPAYLLDVRLAGTGTGATIGVGDVEYGVYGTIGFATTGSLFQLSGTGGQALTLGSNGVNNRVYLATSGYLGIGTTSPTQKLHVAGNINVTATATEAGDITLEGTIHAKYQDVAEWVRSSEHLSVGTVVVLDSTKSNQVISSSHSYDTRVAGVVSAQPGLALGEKGEGKVLVATTGRVKIKVDAGESPIHIGDLLVTSDVPGVAMKSKALNLGGVQIHRPGTLIGKALEPLEKGKGEILVLLSLQ